MILQRTLISDLEKYKKELSDTTLMPLKGRLKYDPKRGDMKRKITNWAVIEVQGDIDAYYRWFLKKEYGIEPHQPSWGPHISVIRGETIPEKCKHLWAAHNNEIINMQVRPFIRFNNDTKPIDNHPNCSFWFLDIISPRIQEIRDELGLYSKWNYHLTIGRMYI